MNRSRGLKHEILLQLMAERVTLTREFRTPNMGTSERLSKWERYGSTYILRLDVGIVGSEVDGFFRQGLGERVLYSMKWTERDD